MSDEESMKQLAELAEMLKAGEAQDGGSSCENSSGGDTASEMPDLEMIGKLTSLAGTFSCNDKNMELLLALKPHLGAEKQQKVDKAIKLLKILAVYNAAKESGVINNLL